VSKVVSTVSTVSTVSKARPSSPLVHGKSSEGAGLWFDQRHRSRPDEGGMASTSLSAHDDRVLLSTRILSASIAPFLLAAFVILYFFPGHTKQLFAWTITPTMTPMVLGSAYLGGFYFFVRVLREPRWNVVRTGFLSVALFASLLGVATIMHWERFNHRHPAFWVWAGLYFTTPFLVIGGWLANRRYAAPARPDEVRLGVVTRWVVGVIGLLALLQGVVMFVAPARVIPIWPWLLTPLTCRVMGAIFCLGSAGIAVLVDPRWTTLRLMLQVEAIMIALMLVAALRARSELLAGRPLTWLMLFGFVAVLIGSAYLWFVMEVRPSRDAERSSPRRRDPPGPPTRTNMDLHARSTDRQT
jgi:hypothetical protein